MKLSEGKCSEGSTSPEMKLHSVFRGNVISLSYKFPAKKKSGYSHSNGIKFHLK